MKRILFVSNGHGEMAIAECIARELAQLARAQELELTLEHFPLVGEGSGGGSLTLVGPQKTMPSGGLVAMGNVGALSSDLRAGFAALFGRQLRFLQAQRGKVDLTVAVGDVYGLAMAQRAGAPVAFVGTAKSVHVAPYGPFERRLLRRPLRVFVRDEATAAHLRSQGVPARAPGNVIADLGQDGDDPGNGEAVPAAAVPASIGLLPGSRPAAYTEAVRLAAVVRTLGQRLGFARALLSIAPGLDQAVFARMLAEGLWTVTSAPGGELVARCGSALVRGWRRGLGPLLAASTIVLGQAGTANELAAASGVPVFALELGAGRGEDWYRMRQRKLLDGALAVVPAEPAEAAARIESILLDPVRLAAMRAAGPLRLGPRGGARAIAVELAELLREEA